MEEDLTCFGLDNVISSWCALWIKPLLKIWLCWGRSKTGWTTSKDFRKISSWVMCSSSFSWSWSGNVCVSRSWRLWHGSLYLAFVLFLINSSWQYNMRATWIESTESEKWRSETIANFVEFAAWVRIAWKKLYSARLLKQCVICSLYKRWISSLVSSIVLFWNLKSSMVFISKTVGAGRLCGQRVCLSLK